ncbi:hypothetical protein BS47DRAFT_1449428 [Hydnum rufescens UP504]|uniref:Mif2/CENP-C cupin domain-containing protein n=1 Tax=Hydnum rufescens UP504 TaxID=1448309 RepID=A0A9P6DV88_9AGAM|nr:hypothetical protein BS47DRAFT_1449428 [Hydnum rufescens UP504]
MARTVRTPTSKSRNKHLSQQPYSEDRSKGRRTGQNIKEVDRDDDGFEDFAELAEANEPSAKRKKSIPTSHRTPSGPSRGQGPVDLFTEDIAGPTPSKYVAAISRTAPSSVGHIGSLSRRVEKSRLTDFDSIPSPVATSGPGPSMASGLRGAAVGTSRPRPVPRYSTVQPPSFRDIDYGDSPLRTSRVENQSSPFPTPGSSSGESNANAFDLPPEPMEAAEQSEEDTRPLKNSSNAKGKVVRKSQPKALSPVGEEEEGNVGNIDYNINDDDDDNGIEDNIEAGLNAIPDSDSEEPPANLDKPVPKATKRKKAASPTKPKAKIVKTHGRAATSESEGNVRRGTRVRIKPLEYWRGERVILGRAEDGPAHVLNPQALGGSHKRKRGTSSRRQNLLPPESGWDENTQPLGLAVKWGTQDEEERRMVYTAAMMEPEAANSTNTFSYQKIFSDDDFIAAGVLVLPVDGEKPMKGTKDNTYSWIIAPGGTFLVPRGNQYYIKNISKRETVLFFAQARRVPVVDEDDAYEETSVPPSGVARHRTTPRSSIAHGSSVTPKPSRQSTMSPVKGKATKSAARARR